MKSSKRNCVIARPPVAQKFFHIFLTSGPFNSGAPLSNLSKVPVSNPLCPPPGLHAASAMLNESGHAQSPPNSVFARCCSREARPSDAHARTHARTHADTHATVRPAKHVRVEQLVWRQRLVRGYFGSSTLKFAWSPTLVIDGIREVRWRRSIRSNRLRNHACF